MKYFLLIIATMIYCTATEGKRPAPWLANTLTLSRSVQERPGEVCGAWWLFPQPVQYEDHVWRLLSAHREQDQQLCLSWRRLHEPRRPGLETVTPGDKDGAEQSGKRLERKSLLHNKMIKVKQSKSTEQSWNTYYVWWCWIKTFHLRYLHIPRASWYSLEFVRKITDDCS